MYVWMIELRRVCTVKFTPLLFKSFLYLLPKVGTKIDDYWEAGRTLLQDPGKFLELLFQYDKDNIPDSCISKIQPYIDNEDFQPAAIAKASCNLICQTIHLLYGLISKSCLVC